MRGGGDGTGADTQKQPHTRIRMPATALGAALHNQPRQPADGCNCKTQNTVSKKNEQLHDL